MTGEQTTFESLAELIGKDGALSLCEKYGGETLYVRKSIALWHPWIQVFGQEAWEQVNKNLLGKRVYIPVAPPGMIAERNAAIMQCLSHGKSTADVASQFKLTARYVAMIASANNKQGEQK